MFKEKKISSKILVIISLLVIVALVFSGCSQDKDTAQQQEETAVSNSEQELSEEELEKEIKDIEEEYTEESEEEVISEPEYTTASPFTGLPLKQKYYKRAIAVSIENSPAARPQSGLREAELVYEFMLEGGITRFLAIFWPDVPEKIGPIRSARPALIEISQLYDAVFLHAGASPDGFKMIETQNVLHLDQLYNSKYFWRSSKRKAPHNLYSGNPALEDYLNKLDEKEYPDKFNFLTASVNSDFTKAEEISIDYWGSYEVFYEYNNLENNYSRFIEDRNNPHSVENGNQIKVKNIIVHFAQTSTKDNQGRQEIDLNSGGKMILFRDGIVINGHWQNNGSSINYYNDQDKEIEINPGKSWIQVVPTGTEISY